eukprot:TRINITY_DN13748_c0_g1_i1.p1 TRINITY_DN13748_c0_g1~~TRINITY_DN13748_c0_g1_i1.p1  ORF type:complete len:693 (+),score=199.97 TRINITY_DN13748_c0_g1_i1:236-2314(+)
MPSVQIQELQPLRRPDSISRPFDVAPPPERLDANLLVGSGQIGEPRRVTFSAAAVTPESARRGSRRGSRQSPQSTPPKRKSSVWQDPPVDVVQALRKLRDGLDVLHRKADPPRAAKTSSDDEVLAFSEVDTGIPRVEVRQAVLGLRRQLSKLSRTVLSAFSSSGIEPVSPRLGGRGDSSWARESISGTPAALPEQPQSALTFEAVGSSCVHGILEGVARELRAERATLFMHCVERDARSGTPQPRLISVAAAGAPGAIEPIRVHPTAGVAGQVFQTGMAFNVQDTESCGASVFTRAVDQRTGFYTKNLLCFPLDDQDGAAQPSALGGRLVGVVEVLNKIPTPGAEDAGFTAADEARLLEYVRLLSTVVSAFKLTPDSVLGNSRYIQTVVAEEGKPRAVPDPSVLQQPSAENTSLSRAKVRLEKAREVQRASHARVRQSRPFSPVPPELCHADQRSLICRLAPGAAAAGAAPLSKIVAGATTLREVAIYIERIEECWRSSRDASVIAQGQLTRAMRRLEILETGRRNSRKLTASSAVASLALEPASDGSDSDRGDGPRSRFSDHKRRRTVTRALAERESLAAELRRVAGLQGRMEYPRSALVDAGVSSDRRKAQLQQLMAVQIMERDELLEKHESDRRELLGALADGDEGGSFTPSPPPWTPSRRSSRLRASLATPLRVCSASSRGRFSQPAR